MPKRSRVEQPVAPEGMALIFLYPCPQCGYKNHFVAPLQPAMVHCGACDTVFPIIPVDERTVRFVQIILGNGAAAAAPDFV